MKKQINKAVNTKAFETASVEHTAPVIYQVRPMGTGFAIYLNGDMCDKMGKAAKTVGEAHNYRNLHLATEAMTYFLRAKS